MTIRTSPRTVRAVAYPMVTVLMDTATGRVDALTGMAHELWGQLALHGNLDHAVAHSTGTAEEADDAVTALTAAGFLQPADTPAPRPPAIPGSETLPSWGTRETPVALAPLPAPAWSARLAASAGLLITLIVAHLGRRPTRMQRMIRLARLAALLGGTSADSVTAAATVNAVRAVGRSLPTRTACLEHATATILAAALRGYALQWCHGFAPDPVRLHSWVETGPGHPVSEPPSTRHCTVTIRIPQRTR
jgi:Transglutaminase-like superfamily